jgi:hypothetical protein
MEYLNTCILKWTWNVLLHKLTYSVVLQVMYTENMKMSRLYTHSNPFNTNSKAYKELGYDESFLTGGTEMGEFIKKTKQFHFALKIGRDLKIRITQLDKAIRICRILS